jgi:hypothetical protein
MTSSVDPTVPVAGNPTTQSVRDNFLATKSELEALQAADVVHTADIATNAAGISANQTGITTLQANTVNAGTGVTGGGAISTDPTVALDTVYTDGRYLQGNQTVTLSGDVSGSGTTSIVTTVANDSHTHTGSTISNLAASDTTSGTFANARISQSSVTQHQSAINAGQVDGYSIKVDSGTPSGTNASTIYFVT